MNSLTSLNFLCPKCLDSKINIKTEDLENFKWEKYKKAFISDAYYFLTVC